MSFVSYFPVHQEKVNRSYDPFRLTTYPLGKVHCLPEVDDVPGAFAINNGQTRQFTVLVLDIKFSWSPNDVVKVLHRDLDDVILGVVHDADERDPFCLNLISQVERSNLDLRLGVS